MNTPIPVVIMEPSREPYIAHVHPLALRPGTTLLIRSGDKETGCEVRSVVFPAAVTEVRMLPGGNRESVCALDWLQRTGLPCVHVRVNFVDKVDRDSYWNTVRTIRDEVAAEAIRRAEAAAQLSLVEVAQ